MEIFDAEAAAAAAAVLIFADLAYRKQNNTSLTLKSNFHAINELGSVTFTIMYWLTLGNMLCIAMVTNLMGRPLSNSSSLVEGIKSTVLI